MTTKVLLCSNYHLLGLCENAFVYGKTLQALFTQPIQQFDTLLTSCSYKRIIHREPKAFLMKRTPLKKIYNRLISSKRLLHSQLMSITTDKNLTKLMPYEQTQQNESFTSKLDKINCHE